MKRQTVDRDLRRIGIATTAIATAYGLTVIMEVLLL